MSYISVGGSQSSCTIFYHCTLIRPVLDTGLLGSIPPRELLLASAHRHFHSLPDDFEINVSTLEWNTSSPSLKHDRLLVACPAQRIPALEPLNRAPIFKPSPLAPSSPIHDGIICSKIHWASTKYCSKVPYSLLLLPYVYVIPPLLGPRFFNDTPAIKLPHARIK